MEFSEEWKTLWTISSVFTPPLLTGGTTTTTTTSSDNSKEIGPVIFNPSPETLTKLFTSPSLSPPLPPPFTNLSLTRFLRAYSPEDSSVLVSTSSSIASEFGPQFSSPQFPQNSLQLLRCPRSNLAIAFFPTGTNFDQIGFLLLSVKNSILVANGYGGEVFTAKHTLKHKIVSLSVNSIDNSTTTVGYLMALTLYSVNWFRVGVESESVLERVEVDFVGSKLFKTCEIVHACWSPHLPEESVVLLESGEIFLFDLESCSVSTRFKGKKLNVLWDYSNISETGKWLSCDFSWHPRILIVAHSSAVFLVDLRSSGCKLTCLLKIQSFTSSNSEFIDRFLVSTIADNDGFYFTVASNKLLLLCDVRKPMMPLLKWAHFLDNPVYMTVFRLSELRSNAKDDKFSWASESGYCILLGSFWNREFNMFCYGPDSRKIDFSQSCMYAWGLPSKLSLTSSDCECGSCLIKEELSKDSLPEWIDWRHKQEMVLGFGVLDKGISVNLSEPGDFGGFTLLRLTSSGNLESQRYRASWDFQKDSKETHKDSSFYSEDSHLYSMGDVEYKLNKKFKYLKFDFLNGYLKDNLSDIIFTKMRKTQESPNEKNSFSSDFHQHVCQKLKEHRIDDALADISVPTSVHEIAFRSIWSKLPIDLLRLAFTTYSEFLDVLVNRMKVSIEFLEVPNQPQMPPFSFRKPSRRSSKWTQKLQPGDSFVGPVVPLPFLVSLSNLQNQETEQVLPQVKLKLECDKILQAVEAQKEYVVPLADDKEEKVSRYDFHKPVALNSSESEKSFSDNEIYTTCVYKVRNEDLDDEKDMVGINIFDTQCPMELKFDDRPLEFGSKELQIYKLLKKQQSKFEKAFDLYQDCVSRQNTR